MVLAILSFRGHWSGQLIDHCLLSLGVSAHDVGDHPAGWAFRGGWRFEVFRSKAGRVKEDHFFLKKGLLH